MTCNLHAPLKLFDCDSAFQTIRFDIEPRQWQQLEQVRRIDFQSRNVESGKSDSNDASSRAELYAGLVPPSVWVCLHKVFEVFSKDDCRRESQQGAPRLNSQQPYLH